MRAGLALAILIGTTLTAFADSGPVIVIPGRPGVPIVINGVDASYAVVEGDWGLAKNIHVQPTVYGGALRRSRSAVGHYYPSNGRMPGYGRFEIEPPANRICRARRRAITSHGRHSPLRNRPIRKCRFIRRR